MKAREPTQATRRSLRLFNVGRTPAQMKSIAGAGSLEANGCVHWDERAQAPLRLGARSDQSNVMTTSSGWRIRFALSVG